MSGAVVQHIYPGPYPQRRRHYEFIVFVGIVSDQFSDIVPDLHLISVKQISDLLIDLVREELRRTAPEIRSERAVVYEIAPQAAGLPLQIPLIIPLCGVVHHIDDLHALYAFVEGICGGAFVTAAMYNGAGFDALGQGTQLVLTVEQA